MTLTRRSLLGGAAVLVGSAGIAEVAGERVFTPEMFGAKGDGVSNDSDAMAALAAAVNANGGGTVELRRTTYRVGRQSLAPVSDPRYTWAPASLLAFVRCYRPLRIRGNGARLHCMDGLRFGTFNRDGSVLKHAMPYQGAGRSTPYDAMINIFGCSGRIEVSDLELDGNVQRLIVGGEFGDTGWQIHALGLALFNNTGSEVIRNIHTHHHAQDGLYIDGIDAEHSPLPQRLIAGVVSEYNGRQGCSISGGRGYVFDRCQFNHTGRAGLSSSPAAGVDIEAEGKKNRNFRFVNCDFADNVGCALVADSGDSEGMDFMGCTFVGTTGWSAWPNKPGMRFTGCTFVGALVHAYGDADPQRAAQFVRCTFRDDPRLSPTGRVYGGVNPAHPLADLAAAKNVLFNGCRFLATHDGTMPWSTGAIYQDCIMQQRSVATASPRGTFVGRTVINGAVDLYGSQVPGEVVVNGKSFKHTHF